MEDDACAEREPTAHGAFSHPRRRKKRGARRKDVSAARSPAPHLRRQRHRDDPGGKHSPAPRRGERRRDGQQRELHDEAARAREFVIGLSHALTPEVTRGGRMAQHVYTQERCLVPTGGDHRAHEFQVLKHRVTGIAAGCAQDRASYADGAGPVATGKPIQQHAASVPARMPRKRIEVVLRTNDVGVLESGGDARERPIVVADVIIRDDDALVRRQAKPGEHAPYLAHRGHEVRRRHGVTEAGVDRLAPRSGVRGEHGTRRAIDHDDFRTLGKPAQVRSQFVGGMRHGALDGQDVREPVTTWFGHARTCSNPHAVLQASRSVGPIHA